MTLTWANLANHTGLTRLPAAGAAGAAGAAPPAPDGVGGAAVGGGGPPGVRPLLTAQGDTAPRLGAIINAMQGDLLGRVMLDRWGRWSGRGRGSGVRSPPATARRPHYPARRRLP
jgi:hypothetical protein